MALNRLFQAFYCLSKPLNTLRAPNILERLFKPEKVFNEIFTYLKRVFCLIEIKPEGVILNLIVSPSQGGFNAAFDRKTENLKLKIKSPPLKGKANQEIEKELKKLFKAKTQILTGFKSRKKTILVKSEKAKVLSALNAL